MQCPKCNWKNQTNARYCSNCSYQLIKPPPFYKRHKIISTIGILFLLFVAFIVYEIVSTISSVSEEITYESEQESYVSGSGPDTIALINIDGIIVENDPTDIFSSSSEEYTSARHIKKTLQKIAGDQSVRAILLRINSPGGSAAASEEILAELKRFKKEHDLPIVTYFTDVAASGGYYVAMNSDRIVANPSTITGSIGVIISYLNFEELAENYGVSNIVYKSGPHKDIVSNFRNPTQEESDIIQSLVNDAYDVFIGKVAEGRKMDISQIKVLSDGRIYSAKQAEANGLIDSVGTFEDAVNETRALAKLDEASVIEFGTEGFFESLLASALQKTNWISLPSFGNGPRILYLYHPGL